jgi:hypothetical protein
LVSLPVRLSLYSLNGLNIRKLAKFEVRAELQQLLEYCPPWLYLAFHLIPVKDHAAEAQVPGLQ